MPIVHAWGVWQRSVYMWQLSCTKFTLQCVTHTDVQAYWIMPSNMKKVQGVPGHAINYTTSTARKRALDQSISEGQSECSVPRIWTHTGCSLLKQRTLTELKPPTDLMHAQWSGLCSVIKEFRHLNADPVQPCVLPKTLTCLHENKGTQQI